MGNYQVTQQFYSYGKNAKKNAANETVGPHIDCTQRLQSGITQPKPQVEKQSTSVSTSKWMSKTVVCLYDGLVLGDREELTSGTLWHKCPSKGMQGKKPGTNDHTLKKSTHMKYPEKANLYRQKVD